MLSAVAVLAAGHFEYDRDRGPSRVWFPLYRLSPTAPLFSMADGQSYERESVSSTIATSYTNGQNTRSEGVETGVRQCGSNRENRHELEAFAETPRARGTKTSRCGISARIVTAESVRSLTKAAVVRGGGSRHVCPSAEKTRECNHVVQCVTRELFGDIHENSDWVLRRTVTSFRERDGTPGFSHSQPWTRE
ncbi:hypothetical protein ALC56_03074 [Trachymyrmex septentrionalis]|uniref:Uncharacterized protein n=1 Tax=Trachymyrmex septentrionalis TaxID=34720 RepID=A0A195FPZ2_9HYME|nr:hypothetical protein ALC56_03074 [Trachymyrmex septentrionalis]